MNVPNPIHLWDSAVQYRGYAIVPVQGFTDGKVVGCAVAVFDPFGCTVWQGSYHTTSQLEDLWNEAKSIADEHIELFLTVASDCLDLEDVYRRVGAV